MNKTCELCKQFDKRGLFECSFCGKKICYDGHIIEDGRKLYCLIHSNPYASVCPHCAEKETGEDFDDRRFW